jgi:hypothetical protein
VKMMKAQRDAFEARAEELFPLRVQAILCNHLPERREELEGPRGLSRLRSSIAGARERGFDAEPWAAEIIGDPRFATPTDRIEALWAAAKRRAQDEDARSIAAALR